jgi:hypothetical protein
MLTGCFNYLIHQQKWGKQSWKALLTVSVKAFAVRNLLPTGTGKGLFCGSRKLRVPEVVHAFLHIHPSRPNRGSQYNGHDEIGHWGQLQADFWTILARRDHKE